MDSEHCDVLVIGGGTAGCVLAGRLAADPARRVTLLEAGPAGRHPLLAIPGGMAYALAAPAFNWNDATEPEPALENRRLFLSQARVLGGGTAINGMVHAPGMPGDYDAWRDAGCCGWGWEDVAPFFAAAGSAPWRTMRGRSPLPLAEAFLAAAAAAGFPRLDGLSGAPAEGFGFYDWNVADGRRRSARAWLDDVGPNLTIRTGARALRLIVERGRVIGCVYLWRGRQCRITAGEVALCAGALRSPQLLMLSGIGPAAQLRRLDIPVLHDLPGVGANFTNHVSYKLQFAANAPVSAYRYLNPARAAAEGLAYVLARRGYLALAPTPVGGFFRSTPAQPAPDMQAFMNPALMGRPGQGLLKLLPRAHGFSIFTNQGRPASRGSVRLASADPRAAPRIIPGYFSAASDLAALVEGAAAMRDLAGQAPLSRFVAAELVPGPAVQGRAALERDIRANATNHYHVAGTCRMGEDDHAVVDSMLRLRGMAGLRIADASVMPSLVNGNTAAPVIMIAERLARMMVAMPTGY